MKNSPHVPLRQMEEEKRRKKDLGVVFMRKPHVFFHVKKRKRKRKKVLKLRGVVLGGCHTSEGDRFPLEKRSASKSRDATGGLDCASRFIAASSSQTGVPRLLSAFSSGRRAAVTSSSDVWKLASTRHSPEAMGQDQSQLMCCSSDEPQKIFLVSKRAKDVGKQPIHTQFSRSKNLCLSGALAP
jgi:hypothetical protein